MLNLGANHQQELENDKSGMVREGCKKTTVINPKGYYCYVNDLKRTAV